MARRMSRASRSALICFGLLFTVNVIVRNLGSNSTNVHWVKIPRCNCSVQRITSDVAVQENVSFPDTSCSASAFARGSGQKIVGFSYYGDASSDHHKSKQYFQGIIDNLKWMPTFYPSWAMRVYYDVSDSDPILLDLCRLACTDPNLDLCDIQDLPGRPAKNASRVFPMNWRFFPTVDPQVTHYVSRDLDSLFSDRELAAVSAWLESDRSFHFMRDHPEHGINILGSAWGVRFFNDSRGQLLRDKWEQAWRDAGKTTLMWYARNVTGPDQGFLRRYVWPWAKRDVLQHDSYTCKTFPGSVGFPTKRKNETNNFVASVVAQNMYIYEKCPLKCRPKDHKDWEYC